MLTEPALAPYCHRQVPAYDHEHYPLLLLPYIFPPPTRPSCTLRPYVPYLSARGGKGGGHQLPTQGLGDEACRGGIWSRTTREDRRAARSEEGNRTSFSKASPSGEDRSVAGDRSWAMLWA